MKRPQIVFQQHEHSLIWWDFWCDLWFCYKRNIFRDWDKFAQLCHSCKLCHITRGFSVHDTTHMHLWVWNSFEIIISIPKESYQCIEGFIFIYMKIWLKLSFQNSYVKQMLTAIKREIVLTNSVNAFQDGIHRRIVKVSAKNQPYLMEGYLINLL